MITVKRGEGKIKGSLGIRDMYKYYKSLTPKEEQIEYKLFAYYIKECNKELLNQIVNNSEIVTMPYRLGDLQIVKYERKFSLDKKYKWALDFKKSREHGFNIYHDQPYLYAWRWRKHYTIVKNKTKYKFVASRTAKRMVAPALEKGTDYFK